jgi:hypothetical protein
MLQYLVFLAAGLSLVSAYVYVRSMLDGHAKPNRITWLMWAVAPIIGFAAAVSSGTRLAAVPVLMAGLSPFLIFAASFAVKEGYWELSKLDYACGILSALAILLWAATRNPDIAIVFAILSDTLASVPTLIKAWRYPETESPWVYSTGVFSGLTGFLAITVWVFSQYAFPAYLVVMNGLLVLSIYGKRVFVHS